MANSDRGNPGQFSTPEPNKNTARANEAAAAVAGSGMTPTSTPTPTSAAASTGTLQLTKSDLLELIRESRRPSAEDEAKADALRTHEKKRRARRLLIVKAEQDAAINRRKLCRHMKPNGELAVGGQPFSNGRVIKICLRCQAVIRSYWSPEIARGMAMAKRMEALGITDADMELEIKREMDFTGVGNPSMDDVNDFGQEFPRGVHLPDLTTDAH